MCGIAGFSGPFDSDLLARMSARIRHRGPDDAGALVLEPPSGRVGLAHRRLSIIDLSPEGHQPMTVDCPACRCVPSLPPERRLWLDYNGEIYNYRELRAGLEAKGHLFHSHSDSEVLLHLYTERGEGMLDALNGIFAFALYDGRPDGRPDGIAPGDLLLARDGLGVKPLYYAPAGPGLLFASEIKALLACPEVSRDIDVTAIQQYVAYLWAPSPRTPLRSVKKLPPGHAMLVRSGRALRSWPFYDLPYGQARLRGSEADIAEELRQTLDRAVERQLVADVPVGAFLSGGLDSSAVVASMRRLRPDEPVRCFCIGFDSDGDDEGNPPDLPYARRVADHLRVDLETIRIEPSAIYALEEMLFAMDEPQADPAPINAMLIAERARERGIPVLMSGTGGDDIFSGYRRHRALGLERAWGWLPTFARHALAAPARALMDGAGSGGWMADTRVRRLAKMLAYADLPEAERLVSYFYWSTEGTRSALFTRAAKDAIDAESAAEPLLRSLGRIPDERDPLNRMLYLEAKHFLADHNLNYTDKTAMRHAVEVRVPLLDMELVDLATRIPPAMKQRGATGKAIFKRAMEPFLPHDVIYRPKTGFMAPLRRWMRDELRGLVDETLSPEALAARGLFDPSAVRDLVAMDRAGRIDGSYTVLSLVCIELWCQMFVDGRDPRPAAELAPAARRPVLAGP